MPRNLFTSEELTQIQQAVKQAEALSGGEIVPVLAKQSSFYEAALWRAGFLFASLAGAVLTILYLTTDWLLLFPPYLWLLIVLTSGLVGASLALFVPSFKRLFVGKARLKGRALDQAKNMFYEQEITQTEQRTGILLYVSFFEHQAIILADVGIDELVSVETWENIIRELTTGLKAGKPAASISEAIAACGRLLAESGVQRAVEDDELPNEVRFQE